MRDDLEELFAQKGIIYKYDGLTGFFTFKFERNCIFFKGHFPFNPILPGQVLIQIARCFLLRKDTILKTASFKHIVTKKNIILLNTYIDRENNQVVEFLKPSLRKKIATLVFKNA